MDPKRKRIGRPTISKAGSAKTHTIRLTPEDIEILDRLRRHLSGCSTTEAVRWSIRRADQSVAPPR